ncbi:MAG: hypothetical protein A2Y25_10200 [Candidatus Melainabacteria bacterium GWF2_37_15]|nr:MAG: hypothetical protein A2Y25_10200 [Candidatus Melainabacteria bacterium GWF2_37_15]
MLINGFKVNSYNQQRMGFKGADQSTGFQINRPAGGAATYVIKKNGKTEVLSPTQYISVRTGKGREIDVFNEQSRNIMLNIGKTFSKNRELDEKFTSTMTLARIANERNYVGVAFEPKNPDSEEDTGFIARLVTQHKSGREDTEQKIFSADQTTPESLTEALEKTINVVQENFGISEKNKARGIEKIGLNLIA